MHISQKCSVALHCLIFINEYSSDVNVTSSLLAKSTGCNPVIIRSILSGLRKAGIISTQSGVGNAQLAKEPDGLRNLFGIHASPASTCPVGKNIHTVLQMPYDIIQKDLMASLTSIRLDSIIKQFHDVLS